MTFYEENFLYIVILGGILSSNVYKEVSNDTKQGKHMI